MVARLASRLEALAACAAYRCAWLEVCIHLELTENRSDSLGSYAVHLKYWRRHSGRRKVTLERTFVVSRRVQSVALQALSCFLGKGMDGREGREDSKKQHTLTL